jgi:hypothetical protein
MFLDTFMDDASEGIMQTPVPELADLQLECAVSLEAAYNDMVLETCQLKYQAMVEGVGVIHEGVIESIKNFFKAIFKAIQKFFGGGSGGGGSSRNIAALKKQLQDKRVKEGMVYILNHPELLDKFKIPDEDTLVKIQPEDIEKGLKDAINTSQMSVQMTNIANNPDGSKAVLDGDKIALDALRVFVKSTFAGYSAIASAKIDSLADFKQALQNHTKVMTPSALNMTEINSYQEIVNTLDELNQAMQEEKVVVKKQMEEFQKKAINEVPPEYANIVCKVTKTLTNATMIYYSYGCRVVDQMTQVARQIFDMAMKLNTKK